MGLFGKPDPKPANENPWYVLLTLNGEQTGEETDAALHEMNRESWAAWRSNDLRGEARSRLFAQYEYEMHERNSHGFPIPAIPDTGEPIDFRSVRFANKLVVTKLEFRVISLFAGSTFENGIEGQQVIFWERTNFDEAKFMGKSDFFQAIFNNGADFNRTLFNAQSCFQKSNTAGSMVFGLAHFHGSCDFAQTNFGNEVLFSQAKFAERADFSFCQFQAGAGFNGARFDGDADFAGVTFGAVAHFEKAKFLMDARFGSTEFKKTADFSEAIIGQNAFFGRTIFDGFALFGNQNMDTQTIKIALFTGQVASKIFAVIDF